MTRLEKVMKEICELQDLLDEMKRQGRSSISFDFVSLKEYWFYKTKIESILARLRKKKIKLSQ